MSRALPAALLLAALVASSFIPTAEAQVASPTPSDSSQAAGMPARVHFVAGAHTGVRFDASGSIVGRKAFTLSRNSSAPAVARKWYPSRGTWFQISAGVWAGYWIPETPRSFVPGKVGDIALDEGRRLYFSAGTYRGHRFSSDWRTVVASKPWTLYRGSSAPTTRSAVIDGARHYLVSAGIWSGLWMPHGSGIGLVAPSTPPPAAPPSGKATPKPTPTPTSAPPPPPSQPVSPGTAVGYGRATVGGQNGATLAVTNLNDSGPGSLRAALEASGRRIVVFRVGGTIGLQDDIKVSDPYVTVAGETAPAPGITLRGGALLVRTHDVVLRHIRLRPGDQTSSPADTDALTLNGSRDAVYNVLVDHVTMLWGPDIGGLAVLGDVRDVTIQNSIMGEGLYLSRHPEGTSAEDGHSHAVNVTQLDGGLAPPRRITFWRNLLTTADTRIPRFQGSECVDVVNNVIYNWGKHSAHGNPRSLNLVNNWYRSGPETGSELFWRLQTSSVAPGAFSGAVYEAGNVADGVKGGRGDGAGIYASSVRCGGLSVAAEAPKSAYAAVLSGAGATAPGRDAVDRRVIANVVNRTGSFFNGTGQAGPNPYWP